MHVFDTYKLHTVDDFLNSDCFRFWYSAIQTYAIDKKRNRLVTETKNTNPSEEDYFIRSNKCMVIKPYLHLQITVYDIDNTDAFCSIDEAILMALLKGNQLGYTFSM